MSIRLKIALLVLCLSTALSTSLYFFQTWLILPEFDRIELKAAHDDIARCRFAIEADQEFMASNAADYAAWDDTYQFVVDSNDTYRKENLIPETFKNLRLNLLAFIRRDGSVVWSELRESEGGEILDDPSILPKFTSESSPIRKIDHPESRESGIIRTMRGPMIFGAAAITTSNRDGEVRGSVIMARFLDADLLRELSERTRVALSIEVISPDLSGSSAPSRESVGKVTTDTGDPNTLRSQLNMANMQGDPILTLKTELPRDISQRAAMAARTALASSTVGGVLLLGLLWFVLMRLVINPLARVTKHAIAVGETGNLHSRISERRSDEIGVLAREFDRMTDQLAESRSKMLDIAHQAGKAQIAVNVLHNVGNVLNSVGVSANVVREKLRSSEVSTVGMAAKLMREHESDLSDFMTHDERGRRLPEFLEQLGGHLASEQESMLKELSGLSTAIEHIASIIHEQQEHAGGPTMLEWVKPDRLLRDAVALTDDSLMRHGIRIEVDCPEFDEIQTDKHRLLQVLVNLITNAKAAVKNLSRERKQISVRARIETESGTRVLKIEVADLGVGIAAEDLPRLFQMGFTTREGGHGIGLHSAANLAREMGGEISTQSDGPDRGAVFTVRIPLSSTTVTA